MTIFGQELVSILCLVSITNGLPTEYEKNSHTSDKSRHFPRFEDSGFIPIIPSPIDPSRPIHTIDPAHINPILADHQKFYRNGYLSTSRPFSVRHISSSPALNRHTSSTRLTSLHYDESILGSGNFNVLRGGTFYPEGEETKNDFFGSSSIFLNTKTGRPFTLERPHYADDPFANFKDFADITAGVDSDFTNLVVVYANKNSTKHEPRNILEQLELIDQQKDSEKHEEEVPIKSMKMTKYKIKLSSVKPLPEALYKKWKDPKMLNKKTSTKQTAERTTSLSTDYVDPLVADS